MRPVRLSEKAWSFVERHRGGLLHDEYVSKLIENVEDISRDGNVLPDGMRIIDVIEAYRPTYCTAENGHEEVARQIIGYLKEAFHGHVRRAIFEKKLAERGLSPDEIARAEQMYRQWLI